MNTDTARSVASKNHQSRLTLVWTGVLLGLALIAVVWVQARQLALLRQALQAAPEYSVVGVYQAEFEYQRLVRQWQTAMQENAALDERALQLRYDIWVSRIALLQSGNVGKLANSTPQDAATIQQAQRFITRADSMLGQQGPAGDAAYRSALMRKFLQAEYATLLELGMPLHAMTLNAADKVARLSTQRTEAIQQQNMLSLGLTAFLVLLTLLFAAAAWRLLEQGSRRRKELEALTVELREARQQADKANTAKSEFLAQMSHEVRTPFHGLMGMLSLLRETGLAPQQQDYLRTATESADHLLAVLDDILDLSQLENGRLRLTTTAVDLRALLQDVGALTRTAAVSKGLSFHVDVAPDVPERVLLDAVRVRQILFNLLSNATKYTDRGAVAMDLRLREGADDEASLEFSVTDTGQGLDSAGLARLFESPMDFRHGSTGAAQGAGLGLEISRKLARAMRGDLTVRSQPGQGCSFTLLLPLHRAKERIEAPINDEGPPLPTRRLHVLVAEDNVVARECIASILVHLGHVVSTAKDGHEAVAAVASRKHDLVLMDLHLPGIDGIAATRSIRALHDSSRSTVPIVALTADAFEATHDACLVAGMNGFLSKPLKMELLASTLRRFFGSALAAPVRRTLQAQADGTASATQVNRSATATTEGVATSSDAGAGGEVTLVDALSVQQLLQTMPREEFRTLAQSYFQQAPHTARRLRAALRDGQPLDLRTNAHAAKGAALTLGLTALATTAHALQQGAEHLPAHEVARLVQRFEALTQASQRELLAQGLLMEEPAPAT